jgi:hypothetical protein
VLGAFAANKRREIERLRFAAAFARDQRTTYGFDFRAAFLLAADQVADQLAVVGESAGVDLGSDPTILLVGYGDGFSDGRHGWLGRPVALGYEYTATTVRTDLGCTPAGACVKSKNGAPFTPPSGCRIVAGVVGWNRSPHIFNSNPAYHVRP